VWLLGFATLVLAPMLGLVAYTIYAAVGKPPSFMHPLGIALASAVSVWLCGDLAYTLLHKLPRTPPELRLPLAGSQVFQAAWLTGSIFLFTGLDQDWLDGPARFVLIGTNSAFVLASMACERILDRRPGEIPE
jgi:hypothetical protein